MLKRLTIALTIGFITWLIAACAGLVVFYYQSFSPFGPEAQRVATLDEALSDQLAWSDAIAMSPDGNWRAVRDSHSTISIRSAHGSTPRIELTQGTLSDLIFTDIAWIDN